MRFLLIVFFACCTQMLTANGYMLRQFTADDGLPYPVVYRIFQESRGYLWLSTDDGLCRFDGRNFTPFGVADGLTSNNVFGLAEDDRGQIWMASLEGSVYVLDEKTDSVRIVIRAAAINTFSQVIKLVLGHNGQSWLLCKNGQLFFFNRNDAHPQLKFISFPVKIFDVQMHDQGKLLAATENGLWFLSPAGKAEAAGFGPAGSIFVLARDRQGNIWCGAAGKIICCGPSIATRTYNTGFTGDVNLLLFDRQNRLWFKSPNHNPGIVENGVMRAETFGGRGPVQSVNAIFCDDEGSIWLATYGDGIFNIRESGIQNFSDSILQKEKHITMLTEDISGTIWFSTINGVYTFGSSGQKPYPTKFAASYESLRILFEPDSTTRLFGTESKLYMDFPARKKCFDTGMISCARDSSSRFWMGSYRALYRYEHDSVSRVFHPLLDHRRINVIQKNGSNTLIATDSGLYCRTKDGSVSIARAAGLPAVNFKSFCIDSANRFWLTSSRGLFCIKNNVVRQYTVADGLRSDKCQMVVAAKNGIWISTLKGLEFFDGKKFLHLDADDGLVASQPTRLLIDRNNRLWVGTVNGLSCIDLNKFRFRQKTLVPMIESVLINGRKQSKHTGGILPPDDQQIRIRFTAIDFADPGTVVFSYRLNATDAWIETKNNLAEFSSLAPGEYVFSVRARSKNSEWSAPVLYHFRILPPFWKTTWFIAAVILLIAGTAVLVAWRRIARVRKQEQDKLAQYKQLQLLKQQSLSNLLNPHFIFNSLNSIQHFINDSDPKQASEYLARFAKLIRQTMNDAVHPFVPLENELSRLEHYLFIEKIRFGNKLQYSIETDNAVDLSAVYIPVLLLQPYAENAIWHGIMRRKTGGKICIRVVSESDQRFNIFIEDNGDGTPVKTDPLSPHPRSGAIMQKRLEYLSNVLEKKISVTTVLLSPGTRVCISMPVISDPPEA